MAIGLPCSMACVANGNVAMCENNNAELHCTQQHLGAEPHVHNAAHCFTILPPCITQGRNERTLYVSLYFDPFQPYKDDANYSITPFQLVVANVPYKYRWDPAYSALLGLVPGSRAKGAKTSPVPFLDLLIDQFEIAFEEGFEVRATIWMVAGCIPLQILQAIKIVCTAL